MTKSLAFTVAGQVFYRETDIDYYVLLILIKATTYIKATLWLILLLAFF